MSRAEIDTHIAALEHPQTPALIELCAIIRAVDPRIDESIKWNSPSFAISEHFATTSLRPRGPLLLVLHTGAKILETPLSVDIDDPTGLLAWKSPDRAIASFADADAVVASKAPLQKILTQWIAATQ